VDGNDGKFGIRQEQVRGTSDLGDVLAPAINRPPTTDVAVAAARYDAATLRTAEEARDRAQQVRVAELRRRFVDGPVLTMPAGGSGTSDTTGSVGIPGAGTVFFRNFTLSAKWGRLDIMVNNAGATHRNQPMLDVTEEEFDRIYREWTRDPRPFHDLVYEAKRKIMQMSMASEINSLAHRLDRLTRPVLLEPRVTPEEERAGDREEGRR